MRMPEICARARGGHRLFYAKSVLKGRCYFRIAGEQGKMDAYRNRYTGDISQVFNAKTFRYETGRARGVLASQINNGGGLDVTVLADRCMDMAHVLYKGINISYINSCGITHPAYYEAEGENWLRGFSAGLLTTCGLTHFGAPSVDEGKPYGLHGRIAYMPAEEYSLKTGMENGLCVARLEGKIRQSKLFDEHFLLLRRYEFRQGVNEILLEDEIVNESYTPCEYMQLYHFNFGYPFIDENAEIFLPTLEVRPRDEMSAPGKDNWMHMEAPADGVPEVCYFHTMRRDENGASLAAVYNHKLNIGMVYYYDAGMLEYFIQWKNANSGEYVLGLEPATNYVLGRAAARRDGSLKLMEPGGRRLHKFRIKFFDSREEFEKIKGWGGERLFL